MLKLPAATDSLGAGLAWDQELDKAGVAYKIAAAAGNRIRVIAGPGTGKSYAMKRRVARLLEEQIPPDKVLAVTFTRVAAEDLHRELQKLDVPGCEDLEGQTLHSLAMRILSRQHVLKSVGRTPRPLNNFEQKAMYQDIGPANGGITASPGTGAGVRKRLGAKSGRPARITKTDEGKGPFSSSSLIGMCFTRAC